MEHGNSFSYSVRDLFAARCTGTLWEGVNLKHLGVFL